MIIKLCNGWVGRQLRKRPTIRNRRGLLSDRDIVTAVRRGELIVGEFDESMLRPASLSLRLGSEAYELVSERCVKVDDPRTHPQLVPSRADEHGRIILRPNEVLIVRTQEQIGLSDRIAGIIDGTSDYARLGVSVVLSHQVSPGYGMPVGAPLTLEIVSRLRHPVYLRPGTRICNLMMFRGRWSRRSYPEMIGSHSTPEWSVRSRISQHLDAGMEATMTMPVMVEANLRR